MPRRHRPLARAAWPPRSHFDLAVHNFGIQEYMPHTAETDAVFPHAYRFETGTLHPGEAPGLGVEIDLDTRRTRTGTTGRTCR